ncbi:MAG TPA: hypothetical protein VJ574_08350 [Candidatus Bathyarchaeia archaeon]|nr:hypothetical protein [Candidatus Bathyarchaeia archaeon]
MNRKTRKRSSSTRTLGCVIVIPRRSKSFTVQTRNPSATKLKNRKKIPGAVLFNIFTNQESKP